jgi:O-antigen/teichoic acid export membrane protein
MDYNNKDKPLEKQSISVTATSLIMAAINGIVGYIAVYFFKPLWEKIVKLWNKDNVH